jgi:hypothetical protein
MSMAQRKRKKPHKTAKSKSETIRLDEWLHENANEGNENEEILALGNAIARLIILPGIEREFAKKLAIAGFDTIEKVANADKKELADTVPDLSISIAEDTIHLAAFVLRKTESGDIGPKGWSKSEKPVRVVKLASIPEPVEKPIRVERPEVGQCTYCSGTLVKDGMGVICRECGKSEQTDNSANDDWNERARNLRRELRR